MGFKTTFAVVGTQRGGSTTLHELLRQHRDIWTSFPKETHFFDEPERYLPLREATDENYLRFFAAWSGEKAVGECTPGYMFLPAVAERLSSYNPDLRLIFVLRDPAARAFSEYQLVRAMKDEALTFGEALRAEEYRARLGQGLRCSYAARGLYMAQIRNMLRFFDRSQMMLVRSEDLFTDGTQVIRDVYGFLGVTPDFAPDLRHAHEGGYHDVMEETDREFLRRYHRSDTEELEVFANWDLSAWKS